MSLEVLESIGSPDWLIQDHPRFSECNSVGRLVCSHLIVQPIIIIIITIIIIIIIDPR